MSWPGGIRPSICPTTAPLRVLVTPTLASNPPIPKCPAASQGHPPPSSQPSPKWLEGIPASQVGTRKVGAPELVHPELLQPSLPTPAQPG